VRWVWVNYRHTEPLDQKAVLRLTDVYFDEFKWAEGKGSFIGPVPNMLMCQEILANFNWYRIYPPLPEQGAARMDGVEL